MSDIAGLPEDYAFSTEQMEQLRQSFTERLSNEERAKLGRNPQGDLVEISNEARTRFMSQRAKEGGETGDKQQGFAQQGSANAATAKQAQGAGGAAGKGAGAAGGAGGAGAADTASTSISDQIKSLEKEIEDLEKEIADLESKAATDEKAKEQLQSKRSELATKQDQLTVLQSQKQDA